jgi:hypothetical protein
MARPTQLPSCAPFTPIGLLSAWKQQKKACLAGAIHFLFVKFALKLFLYLCRIVCGVGGVEVEYHMTDGMQIFSLQGDRVSANKTRVTCVCTLVGSTAAIIDPFHRHFCSSSSLPLVHIPVLYSRMNALISPFLEWYIFLVT